MRADDWQTFLLLIGGGILSWKAGHIVTFGWFCLGLGGLHYAIILVAGLVTDISEVIDRRKRRKAQAKWDAKHAAAVEREQSWRRYWKERNAR